ncbi:MAG: Exodeoxyribonuclease III [Parcubacteria group bacterium GW2011_GWA2_43_11]|nr:MAG: Exodeoxyribonuclease III [Parcubacteria group bacterium GW2011_GWC2_42_11]KKS83733.1 MAG: Exodeoxyribonuclease III [Parcubacteria group bacterium GW2011_GWA2_43_11]
MRITTWNVNGLRAVVRKDLFEPFFKAISPDIVILQETKVKEEQLPEAVRILPGYHAYFNSSLTRAGYSGTGLYTKQKPVEVTYGIGKSAYDQEGRIITAFYDTFTVSNIYFPNGGQGPERLAYKLEFYEHFLEYVEILRKKNPVIWGGDINTAHEEIDLARPKENEKNTGFLPEERAWLDEVVGLGWIDTYRHFYPHKTGAYTYWDMKTAARERNVGWRLDYLFVSPDLLPSLQKAIIHTEIYGSDHCPMSLDVKGLF